MRYDPRTEAVLYEQLRAEYEDVFSADLPLKAAFDKQVVALGDLRAVAEATRSLTYTQLHDRVKDCARSLRQQGIFQGMRVVVRMPNSIEFFAWYHAIHAIGAVAVLVPSLLHTKEVERIFAQCLPDAVICDLPDCYDILQATGLTAIPVFGSIAQPCTPLTSREVVAPHRGADEPAVILYTAGSTGEPRGIVLSARNILSNALQSLVRILSIGIAQDREKILAILPLAHSFGHMTGLWLPLIVGAEVYVVGTVSRSTTKSAFNEFQPTIFFGVPAIYGILCSSRGIQLDSVKIFVSGGDFLPANIRNAFAHLYGRYICTGYGLSEASPVVGLNISPERSSAATISPLIYGIVYKIVPQSSASPSVGELWIKGDNVMKGYFSPEGTLGSGLSDEWLPTGDLVREKRDGSLEMVGRSKEIIIFKGFNIYPQEIENALMLCPVVAQVVVVGLDHDLFGQVPVACVVVRQGEPFNERGLIEHCKQSLASYKIPHKIIQFQEFVLNHLGKIDRRTVKKTLV